MDEVLQFLNELSLNNNREWFEKNKERYLRIKSYIDNLAQHLLDGILQFDSGARFLGPGDCTYRIYRDIRFSQDKTPYKTHIGIFINPPYGKKSLRMGYYLHLQTDDCSIGVGNISLPSKLVSDIRMSIRDNIEEYLEIIRNPEFSRYFKKIGENPVKTAPKGFAADWEYIDLVRPKDYYVSHGLNNREVLSKNFVAKAIDIFRAGKPFMDFINYSVDEFIEDARK